MNGKRTSGVHSLSTLRRPICEWLEPRLTMTVDLEHAQLIQNWAPSSDELEWSDVSLRVNADATVEQWHAKLASYADRLSIRDETTPTFRVSDLVYDASTSTTLVYLQQTLNGLDIVNASANLAVQSSGQVVSVFSSFVDTSKLTGSQLQTALLSPESALASLANHYGWPNAVLATISQVNPLSVKQTLTLRAPTIAREMVNYTNAYVPTVDGSLIPAWRLDVQPVVSNSWLDASVSQIDGSVLYVSDWTSDAQYQVFAYPKESPSDGPRTRVIDPANATTSPYGWHDTDGEVGVESVRTRGNNTIAYRDTDANNRPDLDSYVNGGANLIFNPRLDLTQEPAQYAEATTVNLFYATNRLHDVFANKGFYAAAGNFQRNNYGETRGLADDPLLAEDLDGGGFNNASMTVPPDGRRPRMQMQLFTNTTPARSSSLDNGIIAHEFAHGVTMRLTGGPSNSSALAALQSAALGEGWSDFFALMFTQAIGDTAQDGRGLGTYLLGQAADGPGMRSQRYSYDMSINSLTLGDIAGGTDPHSMGEVWAATLWDLNWALINGSALDANLPNSGLGFNTNLNATTGGNNVAFRMVVHALKLQPINPTFLQARDAILRADQILNGGANRETIWRVFARRGMGFSATAERSSNSNVTEAFDLPFVGSIDFARNGLIGSGISSVNGAMPGVVTQQSPQRLSFEMELNSRVSFQLTPANNQSSLTVLILDQRGAVVRPVVQGVAGAPVAISNWSTNVPGQYQLEVSADEPSQVNLRAVRNATLETPATDSSPANPQDLDGSSRTFARGGINAVVGNSLIVNRMVKVNDASKFIDISTTGRPLDLGDEGAVLLQTTVGNSLLPAGRVVVSNNGLVLGGAFRVPGWINEPVESVRSRFRPGLLPFWDDIDGDTGNVYWDERIVDNVPALIIQWHNRNHFPDGTGSITFQAQVLGSGPVLVRYAYRDIVFGNSRFDNGASATIGFAGPESFGQFSFNTPSVNDGDTIDIFDAEETDTYGFNGTAGQRVDVAFDALGSVNLSRSTVKLLDSANRVLANAIANPISPTIKIGNYDLGILSYVLPSTGRYTVQLNTGKAFDYCLAVTESLVVDTENANGAVAPARELTLPGAALGNLGATDVRDLYDLQLTSGQTIRVVLNLREADDGMIPQNTLLPRVNILSPDNAILATNAVFNSARQIVVSATAPQSGRYRIDLRRLSGEGDYYFRVENDTAAMSLATPILVGNTAFLNSSGWYNLALPLDVNDDGKVTAFDALLLINELNTRSVISVSGRLPPRELDRAAVDIFFDSNGDGLLTPADALLVINQLNSSPSN